MLLLKSLRIGFVGLMLFVASAWAASSVLEGIVKDAKGHPIEGADIRIETKNGGKLLTTVKTDVRGRYILEGLPPGNYRVTLAVNGAVKTSINNTTIESDAPTQLNFDLRAAPASRASVTVKKGRHWVWIPAFTGSRLPGHWVELNDSGSWAGEASSFHVVRVSGEELQRTIASKDLPRSEVIVAPDDLSICKHPANHVPSDFSIVLKTTRTAAFFAQALFASTSKSKNVCQCSVPRRA